MLRFLKGLKEGPIVRRGAAGVAQLDGGWASVRGYGVPGDTALGKAINPA
jgi:hypothetical protein